MKLIVKRIAIVALAILIAGSLALYLRGAGIRKDDAEYHAGFTKTLQVTSSDFAADGDIPARFTCLGPGPSPELEWKNAPANAMSYAVLVVDFDAPSPSFAINAFTHWVVYDIPSEPRPHTPTCRHVLPWDSMLMFFECMPWISRNSNLHRMTGKAS